MRLTGCVRLAQITSAHSVSPLTARPIRFRTSVRIRIARASRDFPLVSLLSVGAAAEAVAAAAVALGGSIRYDHKCTCSADQ